MQNSFASLIESATSVLIMLPVKPNFDTVAAGLSLYLSLHDQKEVLISCPSEMMVGVNRLIGVNKITDVLGNKNLTIRFKNYDANNIDKVSYDIENGEFKLTVVPKSGFTSPEQGNIDLSYSGISAGLVILVGGVTDADFPILASDQITGSKIAHVGIRALASSSEVMSFAKPGASNSEIIAELIRENGLSMDADSATNLVMGIEEGSENFASSETTPETFEIFAHLLRNGGRRMPKVKLSPANFPPGSIPNKPFGKVNPPQRVRMPQMQRPVQQPVQPAPVEDEAQDVQGTNETETDFNPPDDWLQPKVFKGGVPSQNQPTSYSENKG